jgi:hypothetical protein
MSMTVDYVQERGKQSKSFRYRRKVPPALKPMRAQEAERHAASLRAEAQVAEAKQKAQRAEIAAAVELSVANNPQLQAQRMGVTTSRVTSSQSIGMIAPPEVVNSTPVSFNGVQISAQAAKNMVEFGQWDKASYDKALSEALAQHGYKAPGSFR